MSPFTTAADPHANQPLLTAGPAPEVAPATIILLHGRGASAESILSLIDPLEAHDCAALAPQASGHTWYPHSFLAHLDANQPFLNSALARVRTLIDNLLARGVPSERIILLGFSQGACLASESAARNPRRYGTVIAFTGGLIGPPGTPRDYAGSFENTPVFLGASDPDPHVPFARVQETADTFSRMGARVELRRYPGLPHTINEDEIAAASKLIRRIASTK